MPFGYNGKVLHVNLSDRSLEVETPPQKFYRKYFGGSALGLYYLLHNTPPNADPLGPQNTLVLSLSVLTGAPISGQSRMTATAKSPLTGAVGDSQSGGFFPAEMKFSGFDAIVIHGQAQTPVHLWIHEGEAQIRPADHLWGKTTAEVEDILKEELQDSKVQTLQTGPAGEKGVRFASLISYCNRANGRTGMGAVMGSKKLKAITVRGTSRPSIAHPKALNKLARWGAKTFPESDIYGMGLFGTGEVLEFQNKDGGLPTRNWSSGIFEGSKAIDGTTMAETILKDRDTCYACTVRCKRVVEVADSKYNVDPRYGGPEYETLATFGSYCGVDDLEAVAYANQICNKYGMDTISCGATIAWAMDCFDQGILNAEDTGGIELNFGNADAMVTIAEKIAHREGFGDLLAEGSARAAKKLGKDAQDLVMAIKNQELPAHMPQVKRSLGLIYAVNPFGADHQSSEHDPSYNDYPERMAEIGLKNPQPDHIINTVGKVRFALTTQLLYSAMDSLNICQFVFGPSWHLYGPEQLVEAVQLITGWENITMQDLLQLGERRLNMLRAFNARDGIGREADKVPKKLFKSLVGGKTDGIALTKSEIDTAKDMYYEMAGWDVASGVPTSEKLKSLELEWVADLLDN